MKKIIDRHSLYSVKYKINTDIKNEERKRHKRFTWFGDGCDGLLHTRKSIALFSTAQII